MSSGLFFVLHCGHDGTLRYDNLSKFRKVSLKHLSRSFDDEYESRGLKQGYISYKINTCATPGKRDLSAYAGNAYNQRLPDHRQNLNNFSKPYACCECLDVWISSYNYF